MIHTFYFLVNHRFKSVYFEKRKHFVPNLLQQLVKLLLISPRSPNPQSLPALHHLQLKGSPLHVKKQEERLHRVMETWIILLQVAQIEVNDLSSINLVLNQNSQVAQLICIVFLN